MLTKKLFSIVNLVICFKPRRDKCSVPPFFLENLSRHDSMKIICFAPFSALRHVRITSLFPHDLKYVKKSSVQFFLRLVQYYYRSQLFILSFFKGGFISSYKIGLESSQFCSHYPIFFFSFHVFSFTNSKPD